MPGLPGSERAGMSRTYRPQLFQCPLCGNEEYRTQVWVPADPPRYKGDENKQPVVCGSLPGPEATWLGLCRGLMEQVHTGIGVDLLPDSFIIGDVDGKGARRISSLSELRTIERESESRARNGEGQILNWRDLSQDRGNQRTNVFTDTSYETARSRPAPRRRTRSNLPITVRSTGG